MAPAFGGEPDVFDVFKTMLGESGKRFNNPLRSLWNKGVRAACLLLARPKSGSVGVWQQGRVAVCRWHAGTGRPCVHCGAGWLALRAANAQQAVLMGYGVRHCACRRQ